MKKIGNLLLLLINIWVATLVAAETNFVGQGAHDRRLQVDRYTGYKTNATLEEINPLLVLTQINFPSAVKTVQEAIDHALQRSGYRVDWRQSAEAYDIFSELYIPAVHRKLNLMTLKDAITTLAGEAWQLLVDSVNRKLVIQLHAYVPWQTVDGSDGDGTLGLHPQKSISPASQTRANHYPADDSVPAQTGRHHFQHEYSDSSVEQSVSDTDRADGDTPENTVIQNEAVADAVYFEKAEVPVPDNADLYYEIPDRSDNQYTQGDIKPYHSAKMSYRNDADSPDKIPNIHRVQYMPGHDLSPYTDLSKIDRQTPIEEHEAARDLWSMQSVIKAKEGVGSLDEAVIVHYSSISVKELIEILIPEGWVVHYEVSDAVLNQKLVSHAESSRRNALSSLFKELKLKALFYPGQAVVLVAEKEPRSYDYGHSSKFKAIDSRNDDVPADPFSDIPDATGSQPEVDTILRNAQMIKNLMNEMEPASK